jgi:hypothetical protein
MGKRYTAVVTVTEVIESATEFVPHQRKADQLQKLEKSTSEISRMVVRAKTLNGLSKRLTEVSALVKEESDE